MTMTMTRQQKAISTEKYTELSLDLGATIDSIQDEMKALTNLIEKYEIQTTPDELVSLYNVLFQIMLHLPKVQKGSHWTPQEDRCLLEFVSSLQPVMRKMDIYSLFATLRNRSDVSSVQIRYSVLTRKQKTIVENVVVHSDQTVEHVEPILAEANEENAVIDETANLVHPSEKKEELYQPGAVDAVVNIVDQLEAKGKQTDAFFTKLADVLSKSLEDEPQLKELKFENRLLKATNEDLQNLLDAANKVIEKSQKQLQKRDEIIYNLKKEKAHLQHIAKMSDAELLRALGREKKMAFNIRDGIITAAH